MDFGSIMPGLFVIGSLIVLSLLAKGRAKQMSYEVALLLECSPEFFATESPKVGDVVYVMTLNHGVRRSALGTVDSRRVMGSAWGLGEAVYNMGVLGVISHIDGNYLYVDSFGYANQEKGIWLVVREGHSYATPVATLHTPLKITVQNSNEVHFSPKEVGANNAIFHSYTKI